MKKRKNMKRSKAVDVLAGAASRALGKDMESAIRQAEIAFLHTPIGGIIDFKTMMSRASFGILTDEMREAVRPFVQGKRVFDLGAGELEFAEMLVQMGATEVVAIDKALPKKAPRKGITLAPVYFEQYLVAKQNMPTKQDVIFTSWPSNHVMPGFLDFTAICGTVIYLGKNTDGNCCAWPAFFLQCQLRRMLKHIPDRRNDLIIYGGALEEGDKRKMLLEEWAGIDHSKQYNTGDPLPETLR